MNMEVVWSAGLIVMIIVALPCLLVRPLLIAIADRIAGKKSNAQEIQEMKNRIETIEHNLRSVTQQVIGLESSQEFSSKLLENLKLENEKEVK
jgi:type III secretory pathway component EscR